MATFAEGHDLNCPHCNKPTDGKVEDFVIPGRVGPRSIGKPSDCGWCDRLFTVEKLESGQYEVKPIAGTIDDLREH